MSTETKIKELQSKIYTTAHEVEKHQALVKSLSKQLSDAESKVSDYFADLDECKRDARSILEESKVAKPTVKPLFPFEGDLFVVTHLGNVEKVESKHSFYGNNYKTLATQGRTFRTLEEAEAFTKRERAKVYCLERINEVNEGDNDFVYKSENWHIEYDYHADCIAIDWEDYYVSLEPFEYIRTKEAAEQLINDPEFVEAWKCWKGVE